MQGEPASKIGEASIHDVKAARLGNQDVEHIHLVHLAVVDVNEGRNIAAQVEQRMHMNALPSNVTVLSASSGSQLSSTYEAAQQGLLSYWLMKGLEGGANANQDKKITTGELNNYIVQQVVPMAQRRNRQQKPQLRGDSTRVLVSY